LAISQSARVELGRDGTVHVLVGPVTLHLDRAPCEALTTPLACAMVRLARRMPEVQRPTLALLRTESTDADLASPDGAHHES
jgi:hypothetical protein